MRTLDILRYALLAVAAARLRSGLTMLGILVGIAAVVLLTAVGEGVRVFVLGEFTQFGTHLLTVVPGKTDTFGASGATISTTRPLRVEDAAALARLPEVVAVVPVLQGNAEVEAGERSRRTNVLGAGAQVPQVWRMTVATGRFLPDDDYRTARPYVVLGTRVRDELFGDASPLGARVRIGGDRYRVVGVMAPKGQLLGFDLDDTVFIPVGQALAMFDRESLVEIDVLFQPSLAPAAVEKRVREAMIARHGAEDFTVVTQDRMLEVLGKVLNVLTLGVAALGGISLLVGAVGIGTVMTIAVTERTAEIGLLRAIGARRAHVLGMFLVEATALAALGGLAGVAVALGIVQGLRLLVPGLPVAIAWGYIGVAVGLSLLIGLAAGLAPALRAARLHPLEALRAE